MIHPVTEGLFESYSCLDNHWLMMSVTPNPMIRQIAMEVLALEFLVNCPWNERVSVMSKKKSSFRRTKNFNDFQLTSPWFWRPRLSRNVFRLCAFDRCKRDGLCASLELSSIGLSGDRGVVDVSPDE